MADIPPLYVLYTFNKNGQPPLYEGQKNLTYLKEVKRGLTMISLKFIGGKWEGGSEGPAGHRTVLFFEFRPPDKKTWIWHLILV